MNSYTNPLFYAATGLNIVNCTLSSSLKEKEWPEDPNLDPGSINDTENDEIRISFSNFFNPEYPQCLMVVGNRTIDADPNKNRNEKNVYLNPYLIAILDLMVDMMRIMLLHLDSSL